MSELTMLLVIALPLALIMASAAVIIVALLRAAPADVPAIMNAACSIFCRLVDVLPHRDRGHWGRSSESVPVDKESTTKEIDQ